MRHLPIDMKGKCPLSKRMSESEKLLREIEACVRSAAMAETTFGRKAVNDGKLVARLRSGGSVTLDKAVHIRRFMASLRNDKAAGAAA
ncbi:hypothetical protein V5G24_04310 [Xanthobacter sp. VTT E-85241]|uniref:hypothetical protein n=1 Tax=Roseixanthobacter finlandensis TaxID=3119922 RepID=UPI003727A03F